MTATNVDVENKYVTVGDRFTLNVTCFPTEPVKGWEFRIGYQPGIIRAIMVEEGDFFTGYQTFPVLGIIDNTNGTITGIYDLIVGKGNVSQAGIMVSVLFDAIGSGNVTVALSGVGVCNETRYIPCVLYNGTVHVAGILPQPENTTPPPENDTQPPPPDDDTPPPSDDDTTPPPEDDGAGNFTGNGTAHVVSPLQTFATGIVILFLVNGFLILISRRR